jgi:HK97 family phage major capsid protein
VPVSIADSIIQKRTQLSGFRRLATTIANLPGQFDLPTEATKPTAYWVAEGAPITESKSTFGRKRLTLNKVTGLVTFTYESLKDTAVNPSLQNLSRRQHGFESRWGHKIKLALTRLNTSHPCDDVSHSMS